MFGEYNTVSYGMIFKGRVWWRGGKNLKTCEVVFVNWRKHLCAMKWDRISAVIMEGVSGEQNSQKLWESKLGKSEQVSNFEKFGFFIVWTHCQDKGRFHFDKKHH